MTCQGSPVGAVPDPEWEIPRWRWWARWLRMRACFHHDRSTGTSWLGEQLIDGGMRKMFWCRMCGRTWFT